MPSHVVDLGEALVILDARSSYIWAPPLPLPFRVLGLDETFTGRRGVAMWNPQDASVNTITLLHGGPGSGRPGVRTICKPTGSPEILWSATQDAIADALLILPGIEQDQMEGITTTWGTSRLWEPVTIVVDGQDVKAQRYDHPGTRWWVVGADLGDIGLCVIGHSWQVQDHGLLTLPPDLPGYTAKPPLRPRKDVHVRH